MQLFRFLMFATFATAVAIPKPPSQDKPSFIPPYFFARACPAHCMVACPECCEELCSDPCC
ncbi:hypothetical protein BX600DRAFT_466695 [Xylariales sp. PMI_506]|nr:hypothetical protein BX600DRAFT_466695 [Xylariales sp. PMI_506]